MAGCVVERAAALAFVTEERVEGRCGIAGVVVVVVGCVVAEEDVAGIEGVDDSWEEVAPARSQGFGGEGCAMPVWR